MKKSIISHISLMSSIIFVIVSIYFLYTVVSFYKNPKLKIENLENKISYFNNMDIKKLDVTKINKIKNFSIFTSKIQRYLYIITLKMAIIGSILFIVICIINLILWNGLRKIE